MRSKRAVTIQHMVPFMMRLRILGGSSTWNGAGGYNNREKNDYDLVRRISKTKDLNFDFSILPLWCKKYVAMNADGEWFAYSDKPIQDPTEFILLDRGSRIRILKAYRPENYTSTWEKSVHKNPNI